MVLVKHLKIFYLSILGKRGQNNTFHDILEGENVYLDNKNKKLKKSKNWILPKWIVHGFCQKISNFFVFLFEAK